MLDSGLLLQVVLIVTTFLALLIASYTDLKWREVPDWLNYGLIFAALGMRTIFSVELGWNILWSGVLGFLACFLLASFFYYSNQWGGGDSKLLLGMGAVIGISFPFNASSWDLFWFFLALMFLGAVYGLSWMSYLALKKSDDFMEKFKAELRQYKKIHLTVALITVSLSFLGFAYFFVLPLVFFPLTVFYLFLFVSAVEESCFFKNVFVRQLTEGDWLGKDIVLKGKTILRKKTLEEKDLLQLRKLEKNNLLKFVTIKEGVPFVPSFLLAYLALFIGIEFWSRIFQLIS